MILQVVLTIVTGLMAVAAFAITSIQDEIRRVEQSTQRYYDQIEKRTFRIETHLIERGSTNKQVDEQIQEADTKNENASTQPNQE